MHIVESQWRKQTLTRGKRSKIAIQRRTLLRRQKHIDRFGYPPPKPQIYLQQNFVPKEKELYDFVIKEHTNEILPKTLYTPRKRKLRSHSEQCFICGYKEDHTQLVIHHRDQDATNNYPENLRALCRSCHLQVHRELRAII